jgi:tetratricopeptide (TPR) repeat protein
MRGFVLLATLIAFIVGPASAETVRATTEHFVVYSRGSAEETRRFADQLERFDGLMRLLTRPANDGGPDSPLTIFLLRDPGAVGDTADLPSGTAGYYSAGEQGAFAVAARTDNPDIRGLAPLEILFHEYAHHFMLRYFPIAYPGWFVEGFAELYSTVEFLPDGRVAIGKAMRVRIPEVRERGPFPLQRLFGTSGHELPARQLAQYYGTAWMLTHYLRVSGEREGELDRYLLAVSQGRPSLEAAEASFTGGISALERELRTYSRGTFPYVTATGIAADRVEVEVLSMPQSFDQLLEQELAWIQGPHPSRVGRFVERVRSVAPRFPDDAFAQAMLADAHYLVGDLDAADTAAARALAIDPRHMRSLLRRAHIAADRASAASDPEVAERLWRESRAHIVAANRAHPEAHQPLLVYYRHFKRRNQVPPDLAFDGLYRGFEMVPQNGNLRLELAGALAERGQRAEAIALLHPLIHGSHSGQLRDIALEIRARFLAQEDRDSSGRGDQSDQ